MLFHFEVTVPLHLIIYIALVVAVCIAIYGLVRSPKYSSWQVCCVAVISTAYMLFVLVSCKPKTKPASTITAPVPTVDSIRIRLQNQADTSRSHADRAGKVSKSTVTDYENALKTYDSIHVALP